MAAAMQGGLEELQDVVGAVGIARAQPEIGHQTLLGYEGQQRMVAGPARLARIVAAVGACLLSVAGEDRRVHI